MKAVLILAASVVTLVFGGCASVSPEDYAAAKERKADRGSVAGWKGNPYLQTWDPRTSVLPAPVAPTPESLGSATQVD